MAAVLPDGTSTQSADVPFLAWQTEPPRASRRRAWLVSLLLHGLGLAGLLLMPREAIHTPHQFFEQLRHVTPLTAPPRELTQLAPNRGKVAKEVDLESLKATPQLKVPAAKPGGQRPLMPPPGAAPARPAPLPEPPQVDQNARLQMPSGVPNGLPPIPPPQIQSEEKPKLPFETPGEPGPARPTGKIPIPNTSVDEALRAYARGQRGGGVVVGDPDMGDNGIPGGLNVPPTPARNKSSLELLSDPMGVDFKPYLIQVLAAVKRNWMAVIPESARLGRQGRCTVQFAVDRRGYVPKLVISSGSGADALDRAAVAGISASVPLPPLPAGFRGDQVRLQLTFLYNVH